MALLLDANINIRCKAAGALQSLAVHPANQQVPVACDTAAEVTVFAEHQGQWCSAVAGQYDVQVS